MSKTNVCVCLRGMLVMGGCGSVKRKEFMERMSPREASEIIANDMSRTATTACFKSQEGALPLKLTVECQFSSALFIRNTAHKGAGDRLLIAIFQFRVMFYISILNTKVMRTVVCLLCILISHPEVLRVFFKKTSYLKRMCVDGGGTR